MDTVTLSIRLPQDEVGRLERLAAELGTERSAFVKRALRRGAADLMFERASFRIGIEFHQTVLFQIERSS